MSGCLRNFLSNGGTSGRSKGLVRSGGSGASGASGSSRASVAVPAIRKATRDRANCAGFENSAVIRPKPWRFALDPRSGVTSSSARNSPIRRRPALEALRKALEDTSTEFARFAGIARASEIEVMNHLRDARSRGFIDGKEYDDADHAARRALKALNGLIKHLESTPEFGRK